ncbi:unnamed protein product [Caenorhabditis auriculariae]|uniref:Leishmanolysin-like peptidase n=1 Tax=Caenorhabditis auriculariae TaxID=2777116 RepID=A0A8S1HV45_9PELO|nr:unnamed protein product [Caenorhabditis auriculariae]
MRRPQHRVHGYCKQLLSLDDQNVLKKAVDLSLKWYDVKVQRDPDGLIFKQIKYKGVYYKAICNHEEVFVPSPDFFECLDEIDCVEKPIMVDYVWLIKIKSQDYNILASAGPCTADRNSLRPTSGRMFLSKSVIREATEEIHRGGLERLMDTIRHEIAHGLFLLGDLVDLYPNSKLHVIKSTRFTVYPEIINESTKEDEHFIGYSFPKALEKARDYFECPDLKYVEMENRGNGDHFETDFLPYEFMRSFGDRDMQFFSAITYGLMEDSGWFKVDYSMAETMPPVNSGKNPCNFAKSCEFGDYSETSDFYTKCHPGRKSHYVDLLDVSPRGRCEIPQIISCGLASQQSSWRCLEHAGPYIFKSYSSKVPTTETLHSPQCYQIKCNLGQVQFVSNDVTYTCEKPGQRIYLYESYGLGNHFYNFYARSSQGALNYRKKYKDYIIERTVICPEFCEVCAEQEPETCVHIPTFNMLLSSSFPLLSSNYFIFVSFFSLNV